MVALLTVLSKGKTSQTKAKKVVGVELKAGGFEKPGWSAGKSRLEFKTGYFQSCQKINNDK